MLANKVIKQGSILIISLWLCAFALLPLLLVLGLSFLQPSEQTIVSWHLTLSNYHVLINPVFFKIFIHSIVLAFICTFICLIIAYPAAFIIAQTPKRYQSLLLLFMILPFWTSSIIRTYAMFTLLETKGLLNSVLLSIGLIHQPLQILYTNTAVLLGIVYNLLPYMILPLYANIEKCDPYIFEAARDLGASRWKILKDVAIPMTLPGIIAGSILVFLPAMTLFYIPDVLGGAKSLLLGNLVKQQFLTLNDWPGGSATSIVLTVIMLLMLWVYRRAQRSNKVQVFL